jgi:two-component system response regulator CpxR
MSVITVFNGTFCGGREIAAAVAKTLDYELVRDVDLIEAAARAAGVAAPKFERALFGKPSVFNSFTHERERSVAHFKSAIADRLAKDGLVFLGHAGHFVPRSATHVLKVCLIADMKYRVARAKQEKGLDEAQALRTIHKDDERQFEWTEYVLRTEPWNPSLYDIVLPLDKKPVAEAVALIAENARKGVLQPSPVSLEAVRDFTLQARVDVALAGEGHAIDVAVQGGKVTLTINKHVLMLGRLEEELRRIVGAVPGVGGIETRVGPNFYQTDIYRKYDFEVPSKVLLVDDEQEFVQTLSERLLMRDVGSAVAYNGEQALSVIEDDEPEVMILDLKMPGIDGIEVLRRVKEKHPQVEVIILTGHGTKDDEKTCMELGAFAYLRKPVDIELLTKTMNEAYAKIRSGGGNQD